jgi:hypothetical protein
MIKINRSVDDKMNDGVPHIVSLNGFDLSSPVTHQLGSKETVFILNKEICAEHHLHFSIIICKMLG